MTKRTALSKLVVLPATPRAMKATLLSAALLALYVPFAGKADAGDVSASLLWENLGQRERFGTGLAIAAEEGVVAASGTACNGGSCNWLVRAHDAETGITLWEDRTRPGLPDRSQGVLIDDGRVFASGWFHSPDVSGAQLLDFVIRAYDLRHGTLLWQQQIDRGPYDLAEQITARDGRVFAVGRTRGDGGDNSDFALFAFDAATGAELWESITDVFRVDIAIDVAVDQGIVFAAGPVRNFTALLVRAHDAQTGQLLWEDEVPGTYIWPPTQGRLVVQGGLLFVAGGILTQAGDQDFMVRAYDERTGAPRWVQQLDAGGNDLALSLSVTGNRLFAGGVDGCDDSFLSCSFSARALDPENGAVLWQDRYQATPGGDSNVFAIVAGRGRVFAAGTAQDTNGLYQWTLRIYDAASGVPLATELIPAEDGLSIVNGLALAGDLLYATGTISTGASTGDFTVRAYAHP